MKKLVKWFDEEGNYQETICVICDRKNMRPLYDNHFTDVELTGGGYLELWKVAEGWICGCYVSETGTQFY